MTPAAYFLVNVDTDPDPEDTPRDDAAVLAKYRVMKTLIDGRADGKAALCVQTSPLYRDRFIEEPFLGFFRDWAAEGADLVLHPEEDLYGTPETRLASGTRYADTDYMAGIIADRMQCIAERGLAFAANRGGYHGFTKGIAGLLRRAGIGIDLTCAPGIEWPEKVAPWGAAPLSAYYMAADDPARPAAPDAADALFEIPSGWGRRGVGHVGPPPVERALPGQRVLDLRGDGPGVGRHRRARRSRRPAGDRLATVPHLHHGRRAVSRAPGGDPRLHARQCRRAGHRGRGQGALRRGWHGGAVIRPPPRRAPSRGTVGRVH